MISYGLAIEFLPKKDLCVVTISLPLWDSSRNQRENCTPAPSGLPKGTDEAKESRTMAKKLEIILDKCLNRVIIRGEDLGHSIGISILDADERRF